MLGFGPRDESSNLSGATTVKIVSLTAFYFRGIELIYAGKGIVKEFDN